MTHIDDNTLPQSDYVVKFGILNGQSIVRGISFEKLLSLPIEKMAKIFQPDTARLFRQFALETIVNGHIKPESKEIIHDLANLTTLSMTISSLQYRSNAERDFKVEDIKKSIVLNNHASQPFVDILLDMFVNNEINISITHPTQFGALFGTVKDECIESVVNKIMKKYDLIKNVHLVSLPAGDNTKDSYLINTIFPSIARVVSSPDKPGRQIRGMREVTKHINDIRKDKFFTYTEEEREALLTLLERVSEEVCNAST